MTSVATQTDSTTAAAPRATARAVFECGCLPEEEDLSENGSHHHRHHRQPPPSSSCSAFCAYLASVAGPRTVTAAVVGCALLGYTLLDRLLDTAFGHNTDLIDPVTLRNIINGTLNGLIPGRSSG
jgi:hypothetical protein